MTDNAIAWTYALVAAIVTAAVAATATKIRLLPEVIDVSIIPTGSGVGSLLLVAYGAARRYAPDRLGRLSLLGTLLGGSVTALALTLALLYGVLS